MMGAVPCPPISCPAAAFGRVKQPWTALPYPRLPVIPLSRAGFTLIELRLYVTPNGPVVPDIFSQDFLESLWTPLYLGIGGGVSLV
jgi:hypothetical protein